MIYSGGAAGICRLGEVSVPVEQTIKDQPVSEHALQAEGKKNENEGD